MIKFEQHRDESGELHRIGGPAIIFSDGTRFWYRHGKYHRRGGPATVYPSGSKLWLVNGRRLQAPDRLPERAHSIMEIFL